MYLPSLIGWGWTASPGRCLEEGEREPGEVGAGHHEEEPGGTGAQWSVRGCACSRRPVRAASRATVRDRPAAGLPPIEVHPRAAHEVGDGAVEQRMAAPGVDARGHVEEALSTQELRQRLASVDPAAVQVASTLGDALAALGPRCGQQVELNAGKGVVEPGGGLGQHDLAPGRVRGCHLEEPGAPRAGRVDLALGVLHLRVCVFVRVLQKPPTPCFGPYILAKRRTSP